MLSLFERFDWYYVMAMLFSYVFLNIQKCHQWKVVVGNCRTTGWPIKKWIIINNRRVCDASGLRVISWPDDGNEKKKKCFAYICGEPVWLFGCSTITAEREIVVSVQKNEPLWRWLSFFLLNFHADFFFLIFLIRWRFWHDISSLTTGDASFALHF
jgi:hypothetical protein